MVSQGMIMIGVGVLGMIVSVVLLIRALFGKTKKGVVAFEAGTGVVMQDTEHEASARDGEEETIVLNEVEMQSGPEEAIVLDEVEQQADEGQTKAIDETELITVEETQLLEEQQAVKRHEVASTVLLKDDS